MTVRVLFKGQPLTTNVYATYDGFSTEENTYAYYTEGHKDGGYGARATFRPPYSRPKSSPTSLYAL